MGLVKEAFDSLYPEKSLCFELKLSYSGRFKPYNANVRKRGNLLRFNLSRSWKGVDRSIVIGLVQELIMKVLKDNDEKTTVNIDLYNNFIRNLHLSAPKTKASPGLKESFERVNSKYFFGLIDMPNLVWGSPSRSKLASYNYHTDTVTVSSIFMGQKDLVDYLMFHELIHKKIKFTSRNGKSFHHTSEFRRLEKSFDGLKDAESNIKRVIRSAKTGSVENFFE